jgi:hypothetical protein
MVENQLYGTFIVTEPGRTRTIWETSDEVDWRVIYRDDPSQRHWADHDGSSFDIATRSPDAERLQFYSKQYLPCQQLVIEAHDDTAAENLCSLILGGILLAYPDAFDRMAKTCSGGESCEVATRTLAKGRSGSLMSGGLRSRRWRNDLWR